VRELPACGVIKPHGIEWPTDFLRRNHPTHALDRRYRSPRTRLGVVGPRAAVRAVLHPITRRYPIVGSGHLYPAGAGKLGWLGAGGGDRRVGPCFTLLDGEVHLLDIRRRGIVAAIQPDERARMSAQPADLIAQRCRRDRPLLRTPFWPFFPRTAAHPASHDEKAEAVGLLPETVRLVVAFV